MLTISFIYKYIYPNLKVTYEFVALMVELIKVMTSRFPARALKHADGKGFLSRSTSEGLRVTLQSTKELLAYLTHKVGYLYLMTSRLSQDCIERLFGIVTTSEVPPTLPAAATKEWDVGGLLYLSKQLFKLILTLENKLAQVLSTCQLHAGLMVEVDTTKLTTPANRAALCFRPSGGNFPLALTGVLLHRDTLTTGARSSLLASATRALRMERSIKNCSGEAYGPKADRTRVLLW
ncbi:hypothetical protein HPB47_015091 [Ixodes persulcatus]|uniref:Uncharacterized protein n=1 Tax=Ixodes persulcatus TaxID=34615 RepID=A0AC60R199_IXOPE|nr:hypothetical protein HPB47_015091 [Ixodes persulcatus]